MISKGLRAVAVAVAVSLTVPAAALAQDLPVQDAAATTQPDAMPAAAEQEVAAAPAPDVAHLSAILAPIALYPDPLLGNILTASTYPLEVVDADRWLSQPGNADLTGDALIAALQQKDWDPSVKSLAPFPPILKMMDSQLDWTQQVGDAFLGEQEQVLDTVQQLRRQAQVTGGLASNAQQTVTNDGSMVEIQPGDPQSVSVPAYDPSVYGDWPYPQMPPAQVGAYGADEFAGGLNGSAFGGVFNDGWYYGPPILIVSPVFFWGHFDWHHHSIVPDHDRVAALDPRHGGGTGDRWEHDPAHRRGVAYQDMQLRQRFQPDRMAQRPASAPVTGQFGGVGDEPQRLFRPPSVARPQGQGQWSERAIPERAAPEQRQMPARQWAPPQQAQGAVPQNQGQRMPQTNAQQGQARPAVRPPGAMMPRAATPGHFQAPGFRPPQPTRTGFAMPQARVAAMGGRR